MGESCCYLELTLANGLLMDSLPRLQKTLFLSESLIMTRGTETATLTTITPYFPIQVTHKQFDVLCLFVTFLFFLIYGFWYVRSSSFPTLPSLLLNVDLTLYSFQNMKLSSLLGDVLGQLPLSNNHSPSFSFNWNKYLSLCVSSIS